MKESLDRAGFTPEMLDVKKKVDFSNLGDTKAWKHIWGAGHAVGQTWSIQTVQQLVDELVEDYRQTAGNGDVIASWPRDMPGRSGAL